jgi:hypothetical protein
MKEIKSAQRYPEGFNEYMATYGGHFSKTMCEWAVSMMRDKDDNPIDFKDKEAVDAILTRYGVTIENDKGYDKVYAMHMAMADFMGSSIEDETHLALYVKDLLDDPDGYDELVFNRFMMDCMGKDIPIMWEDML